MAERTMLRSMMSQHELLRSALDSADSGVRLTRRAACALLAEWDALVGSVPIPLPGDPAGMPAVARARLARATEALSQYDMQIERVTPPTAGIGYDALKWLGEAVRELVEAERARLPPALVVSREVSGG